VHQTELAQELGSELELAQGLEQEPVPALEQELQQELQLFCHTELCKQKDQTRPWQSRQ
jgi:hypothetical protein